MSVCWFLVFSWLGVPSVGLLVLKGAGSYTSMILLGHLFLKYLEEKRHTLDIYKNYPLMGLLKI